jgi:ADP-ribosylation factor 2-binding protein
MKFAEEQFQTMVNSFMEEHVHHFEDTEENKLIYTEIFKEYVSCLCRIQHFSSAVLYQLLTLVYDALLFKYFRDFF